MEDFGNSAHVRPTVLLSNGVPLVWNIKDVKCLHETYRISGRPIGCLPRAPSQTTQLSLPLLLMPEEVALLLEEDLIGLVEDEPLSRPGAEQVEKFKSIRENLLKEQGEQSFQERKRKRQAFTAKIIAGKRAKRRRLLEERRQRGEHVAREEFEAVETEEVVLEDVTLPPLASGREIAQLFTVSPWQVLPRKKATFNYPVTPRERARYLSYRSLWRQGYWLTDGTKFGGDFLVYPGDPLRYHAFYVARCDLTSATLPYEASSNSRLDEAVLSPTRSREETEASSTMDMSDVQSCSQSISASRECVLSSFVPLETLWAKRIKGTLNSSDSRVCGKSEAASKNVDDLSATSNVRTNKEGTDEIADGTESDKSQANREKSCADDQWKVGDVSEMADGNKLLPLASARAVSGARKTLVLSASDGTDKPTVFYSLRPLTAV